MHRELHRSDRIGWSFHGILLAAAILTLFASSSLSADIKTLRKQAEAGDANAQFNIGSMYENGLGVKQDYAEAAKWYRKAAERGEARAQYNLGIMNQNGWGVPQDPTEAVKWYRKAAMQGVASAQYNLGFMYFNGQGVPQNYAEAAKWYRKAAEQGDVDATRILGLAYYLGKWVPQDFVQSYFWFSLAASRASGDEYQQASEAKERVAKELTPEKLKGGPAHGEGMGEIAPAEVIDPPSIFCQPHQCFIILLLFVNTA